VEKSISIEPVSATASSSGGMLLLSGKILFQFGSTTTYSQGTAQVAAAGYVEMHPNDAGALGVKDGGQVRVTSSVGSILGPVRISAAVPAGLLFAPYHFADVNIQQLMPTGQNLVAVQIAKV
jgi:formate dehydrogenase (NADP+) alpha subunit